MKTLLNKKTAATLALCLSMSMSTFGQSQVIHLSQNKATVSSIIKAIEKQTQMSVDFSQNTINLNKTVSLKSKSMTLAELMNQILAGDNDLTYKIVDRHIVVVKSTGNTQQLQKNQNRGGKYKLTGCVLDQNGEPIIGASVLEKGTKNGTVTDVNGNYILTSTKENPMLEISYIGFVSQQVKAKGGVATNITMKENAQSLEELVVVGYGSQKKENLTGSVSSVSSKELAARPITSVKSGIQGLVPGLQITNSQGRPGEDNTSMTVRGVGTLNNSSPYILIDGVESGTMNAIDPNDIESISVLKDAASAAIYGSKAANGVILITTKRGKSGKPTVNYNGTFGWQVATGHVERMHSADAADYLNKALESSGKSIRFLPEDIQKFRDGSDPYGHPDTDWQDLAYQGNGFMHQHSASVNGGNDNASYMVSAGYLNQNGIMQHSNREQFNLRSNVDVKLSDKFSVHTSLAYINNKYEDPTNSYVGGGSDQIIRQVNLFAPWVPYKNEDGTYGTLGDGNPIAWLDLDQTIKRRHQNFTGILAIDYQILKQLKFTAKGAYISQWESTDDFMKDIQYNSSKYHGPNSLNSRRYSWNRPSLDLLLNYNQSFGRHNLKGLAGYHIEKYNYDELRAYRNDFPNNELTDMNAGTSSSQTNSGYTRELAMMSYFGRVNYDYAGRYLFEANFRADASSRFAPGNRWGYYPSFSAGWRISEENFMESTRTWLQNLKLRASWGQLGNQDALSDYYPWLATYAVGTNYPFGGQLESGVAQTSQKLSTISWEKTTTWGIGLDVTLLDCIDFTIDYYSRKTTGIIMSVPVPGSYGLSAYKDNVGAMRNSGIEMSLSFHKRWGDWGFNATGNFAYNKNEVLDLGGVTEQIDSYIINRVGEPYQSFYGYVCDGMFRTKEEADAYTEQYGNPFGASKKFKAGDLRYKDVDGDGSLTAKDRTTIGTSQPKFTYGLNLSASWKNLDVSMLMQGALGVYRYFNAEVYGDFTGDTMHPCTAWFDAFDEKTNPNGKFPRIAETSKTASYPNTVSSYWVKRTNYLRFKNIQIGYTLPKQWLSHLGISNLRIFYSGENLFKVDNLPINIDPESPSGRGSHYPQVGTHSFGINLTF